MGDVMGLINAGEAPEGLQPIRGSGPLDACPRGIPSQFMPAQELDIADGEGGSLDAGQDHRILERGGFRRLEGVQSGKNHIRRQERGIRLGIQIEIAALSI